MDDRWKGQSKRLANLRAAGQRELANLSRAFNNMTPQEKAGRQGQAIQQQRNAIKDAIAGSYLNSSKPKPEVRFEAEKNGNILATLTGRKGARGKAAAQERRNRIFYQQMRTEAKQARQARKEDRAAQGDEPDGSAFFGGVAGRMFYEKIFYMATQDMWRGGDPSRKNEEIMRKLGTNDLETAYQVVLGRSTDVIARIAELLDSGELTMDMLEDEYGEIAAMLLGRGAQIQRERQAELDAMEASKPTRRRRRRK